MFVPAGEFLYGSLDKNLNHYRRYDKAELINKVRTVKFEVKQIKYCNFIGIFGWLVNSKILKRKKFSILQPLIFDKFVPIISKIEEKVELPIGMNLLLIGEKNEY